MVRPRSCTLVRGPDGVPLTLSDLPPTGIKRWTIRRKAEVVAAVRGGLLTIEEACDRYQLGHDELMGWYRYANSHGLQGLRVTAIPDRNRRDDVAYKRMTEAIARSPKAWEAFLMHHAHLGKKREAVRLAYEEHIQA